RLFVALDASDLDYRVGAALVTLPDGTRHRVGGAATSFALRGGPRILFRRGRHDEVELRPFAGASFDRFVVRDLSDAGAAAGLFPSSTRAALHAGAEIDRPLAARSTGGALRGSLTIDLVPF